MFTQKQKSLFSVPAKSTGSITANPFLSAAQEQSARTLSGNLSVKYSTTGNDFLDQFSNLGTYRAKRPYQDIANDCVTLWHSDPTTAVKFILYIRTVSRIVQLPDGSKTERVQKGQGLKHEAIMRMIWLHVEHPDTFWKNIGLFISVGSWKDIFQMLTFDLEYNGWKGRVLNWDKFGDLFKIASTNEHHINLFKKYMPQIQAKSKCVTVRAQARTMLAKWLANLFELDYKGYRLLKRSGNAHQWQQIISRHDFDKIDFNSIHGRALLQLTTSKFLANQNLTDKYQEWIEAQPIAKFTGYVHELAQKIQAPDIGGWRSVAKTLRPYEKMTINKQYQGLVELAKKDEGVQSGLLVVRDTSASMSGKAPGINMSAGDIAKALGIFFGDMLEGPFKNAWMEFHSTVKMHFYKASNFVDKWLQDKSSYVGSTNFVGVARELVKIKNRGVAEKDFPVGILCISDGEFNRTGQSTNVETFKDILRQGGFSRDYVKEFKIVLWDIRNTYYGKRNASFETIGSHDNTFYLSGYDGSIVSFLLGGSPSSPQKGTPKNAEELFEAAMDQEVLNMIAI